MPSDLEMVDLLKKAGKKPEEIARILSKETPPAPKDEELDVVVFEARGGTVVRVPKGAKDDADE